MHVVLFSQRKEYNKEEYKMATNFPSFSLIYRGIPSVFSGV